MAVSNFLYSNKMNAKEKTYSDKSITMYCS